MASMPTFDYDAVIAGAGAAGLMAAIHAAERGRRVLLLEKGKKPGVKILMSGGTRCNITHDCDARGIVEAFGPNGKFLHSALAALGPRETVAFFEAEGVATKVEETGKVFPVSDRAVDVLDALLRRLAQQRRDARPQRTGPRHRSRIPKAASASSHLRGRVTCENVLITTGGQSYPGCGTTGDGYAFATAFGHTIVPPRPALVPLTVQAAWVAELRGITLPDVNLKVLAADGDGAGSHGAGRCCSPTSGLPARPRSTSAGPSAGTRTRHTHARSRSSSRRTGSRSSTSSLRVESRRQRQATARRWCCRRSSRGESWTSCSCCAACRRPHGRGAGKAGPAEAGRGRQAAADPAQGHARLREGRGDGRRRVASTKSIRGRCRASCSPGLYFAGEVLDLDGWIGGYNFQSAWSTGWLAGRAI